MKIMISVGEASGDMHAAKALQQLIRVKKTSIEAFGMGGKRLAASGMELTVDNQHHAVMGLVEVLHKYPQLRSNLQTLKRTLRERQPDVLLLVDYPHFNMKLAAEAKSLGIPVIYYIAPKVWASRPGRLQELGKLVDHMAVILPFEVSIFEEADIPATFVGNPLLDNAPLIDASKTRSTLPNGPHVALLPGSRKGEISSLLPVMLGAAEQLKNKYPTVEFYLPVAETIEHSMITEIVDGTGVNLNLIDSQDYKTLAACKAAIVASGTATLELAILGVPMTVAYRMNQLSYAVVKRWLTIKYISLVNIIAEREVVSELLQDDVSAESLFEHTDKLLSDDELRTAQKSELSSVYKKLGNAGAASRLCKVIQLVVAQNQAKAETNRPVALSD